MGFFIFHVISTDSPRRLEIDLCDFLLRGGGWANGFAFLGIGALGFGTEGAWVFFVEAFGVRPANSFCVKGEVFVSSFPFSCRLCCGSCFFVRCRPRNGKVPPCDVCSCPLIFISEVCCGGDWWENGASAKIFFQASL